MMGLLVSIVPRVRMTRLACWQMPRLLKCHSACPVVGAYVEFPIFCGRNVRRFVCGTGSSGERGNPPVFDTVAQNGCGSPPRHLVWPPPFSPLTPPAVRGFGDRVAERVAGSEVSAVGPAAWRHEGCRSEGKKAE